ncbi:MAG: DNA translocase FtsK 4TM domain-containing protein, partial [Ilumatobacteraceae bacterium]
MNTWGASKKPSASGSSRSGSSRSGASGSGSTRSTASSHTPPPAGPGRGSRAQADLRHAVEGREHEFVGIVLIGVGVLLGLAMYFDLAGPLGRGVETFVGWFFGLGRFVIPPVMVAAGVALVRKGRSSSPTRLLIGWGLVAVALLGMLHIVRDPSSFTSLDDIGEAGGWIGALIAEPMQALVARAGSVVILIAVFLGGVLLVTSTSLRTMASHTGKGVGTVARPIGRAAKRAISDLSTLSGERAGGNLGDGDQDPDGEVAGRRRRRATRTDVERGGSGGVLGEPLAPALFDGAEHDDALFSQVAASTAASPKKRVRKAPAGQSVLPVDGRQVGQWVLPPIANLKQAGVQAVDMAEIERRGQTLQQSLSQHNVETELIGMTVGPTVTRYELELGPGVKVARITSLQKDIAYAMAATDVRILAPIPGRSAIGVEVPNHQRQLVALGDLMMSPEAAAATHPLEVAVGKDIAGKAVFLDLSTTPHLLIAGATGAGKSSGINCIITSLLMRTTPDQVRLILIDPKQVEMGQYQRLPHLLTQPVTNPKKAANALGWAVKEMERRYDVLSEVGFRDITGYNAAVERDDIDPPPGVDRDESPYEHMPYIVVVVDELNDLMMVAARDVEESITRIAQKARAVG